MSSILPISTQDTRPDPLARPPDSAEAMENGATRSVEMVSVTEPFSRPPTSPPAVSVPVVPSPKWVTVYPPRWIFPFRLSQILLSMISAGLVIWSITFFQELKKLQDELSHYQIRDLEILKEDPEMTQLTSRYRTENQVMGWKIFSLVVWFVLWLFLFICMYLDSCLCRNRYNRYNEFSQTLNSHKYMSLIFGAVGLVLILTPLWSMETNSLEAINRPRAIAVDGWSLKTDYDLTGLETETGISCPEGQVGVSRRLDHRGQIEGCKHYYDTVRDFTYNLCCGLPGQIHQDWEERDQEAQDWLDQELRRGLWAGLPLVLFLINELIFTGYWWNLKARIQKFSQQPLSYPAWFPSCATDPISVDMSN